MESTILKINKKRENSKRLKSILENIGVSLAVGSLLLLILFIVSQVNPEIVSKLLSISKDKFSEFTLWLIKLVPASAALGTALVVSPPFVDEATFKAVELLKKTDSLTEEDIIKYNQEHGIVEKQKRVKH